eukprot:1364229-Amorphochlora_amoeboformis.AAC.1
MAITKVVFPDPGCPVTKVRLERVRGAPSPMSYVSVGQTRTYAQEGDRKGGFRWIGDRAFGMYVRAGS